MRSPRPAMRNADGPMSTPRRLPPRSSGTPMMWTDLSAIPPPGEEFRDRAARGATVGDAVRNADAAESAAGDEQAAVFRQRAVDRLHARQMTDVVLRVGAFPAVHPREQRRRGDTENRRDRIERQ